MKKNILYVIWARMGHTSPTAMPRNTVWKTKRGKLKHYALVICTLQDAYMYVYAYTYDICIFTYICIMRSGYIRHLVYSSSASPESPYFPFYCSSLVTAMSRYKSPAKKFCQIFGDNFGGKYKFRNLFPNIQLDISCLPLWVRPSNLKKRKHVKINQPIISILRSQKHNSY